MPSSRSAWPRACLAGGAVLGLLTVAGGALAAHLPPAILSPEHRALMRDAVQMQGWHAAALLVCGLLAERAPSRLLAAAAGCFAAGTLLFAGGVDSIALGRGAPWSAAAGRLAPVGGTILMLGWLLLAVSAFLGRDAARS